MSRACLEFCLSSIARLGLGRKPRTGATHAVLLGAAGHNGEIQR